MIESTDKSTRKIAADFDRIALLSHDGWDHNSHYHSFLLKRLPPHCMEVLEIGCGTGAFSRLLAERSRQVLALDLSPQMVQIAKERSRQYSNIDFQAADALAWEFPAGRFDCVASIATLHHLPFEEMLSKMKSALRINGTLLVLDLFQPQGPSDWVTRKLAKPADIVIRLIKLRQLSEPGELQAAWEEHSRGDSYLTLSQVRQACASLLPGAKVRRHLLWRYSIIWKKPVSCSEEAGTVS